MNVQFNGVLRRWTSSAVAGRRMQIDETVTAPGAAVRWLKPVKFRLEEMREVLGLLEE